jgi:hypothetical protein
MSPGSTVLKSLRLRGTSHPARASPRSGPGVRSETLLGQTRRTSDAPTVAHRGVHPAAHRNVESKQHGPGHRGLFLTVTVTQ